MATTLGRPSKYQSEYAEQAYKFCLLGADDAQLAVFFDTTEQTINAWKKTQPGFLESLRKGKGEADANVAKSLYHRALGYEHEAVKIFADAKTGMVTQVEYTEHYPPDTAAAFIWLKNRQRDKWRDRSEVEAKTEITHKYEELPDDELDRAIKARQDRISGTTGGA